jgi:RND family efflux transporter MFP subunit
MNARPLVALFVGLVALALAACGAPAADPAEPATPVRVADAWNGPASPAIETSGSVGTKNEMRLSFKVGGVIRRIDVEEGDTVRKGERLAEIELTEVNAQVEQAAQLADKAQRDLERGERLYADQVISLEQLEDLRTQASVARAQAASAQFNRGYSVIVAPADGVVMRKLAEERELVGAGVPVLVVGDQDRGFVVRAALADREIVQVRLGDAAEIRMDAYPGQVLTGKVSEVSSAAVEGSGMFPVEVRLDSPPAGLVNGLVAKLSIVPSTAKQGSLVYVPIAAVVEGDGDTANVFLVRDGRAVRQAVTIAFIGPDSVALRTGVTAGETIVTDGALYLVDGESIAIVKEAAQAVGGVPYVRGRG